ncbi:hypothetical protein OJAV_G00106120 [Oryzias javanicus]|uniref:Fibronectin type-III domain-containing protein n=1 Tax=Oryzias javanicus TaxID=123683 RepID=A0A3S2MFT0_ORYJA|nr:hypothetical protein OJAV_G00106120 [Oryzias javanicus]
MLHHQWAARDVKPRKQQREDGSTTRLVCGAAAAPAGLVSSVRADTVLSAPLNVTIRELGVNSAVVTWEILEGDPVIGFAITQQKKDVHMLRFIQEVNTTTRSCALWDLDEDTEYIVHVQSISMGGSSPPSQPVLFRTPKESEKMAAKSPDEVTMEEVGQAAQLRAGELIIIVVVLVMWAVFSVPSTRTEPFFREYHHVKALKTWEEAQQACRELHSDLAWWTVRRRAPGCWERSRSPENWRGSGFTTT